MTGYDDDGYTKKDLTDIIIEKEEEAKDIFDIVNYSVSDPLWQWLKIVCQERFEIETMNEIASYMMSIQNAVGVFLDKHGIECGIERKGATKSQGYVEMILTLAGASITIPSGTRFTSVINTYTSDSATTAPILLTMTKSRTGVSYDYFPTYIDAITTSGIAEIKLANGDVVDPADYSVDPTYLNNIIWVEGSSSYLEQDEQYTVQFTGNMTLRIEVSSELEGEDTNALIGDVDTCIEYPSNSVTNKAAIDGGADQESDADYRTRLLAARRRTFTLGSIKDIILGLEGVRSCKVYQAMGVDQTSCIDWDNKSTGAILKVTGQRPMYSQSFVSGDLVATLGRITLFGKPYNFPPAIYVGIKRDISDIATGIYFDYVKVESIDLDPTITGYKDIPFNIKYNGLDKTKTYRFDLWCDDPVEAGFDWDTNYWEITTTTGYRGGDSRGALYEIDEHTGYSDITPTGLVFKTHFNGAGYNVVISTEDGYGFNNIELEVENYLDYVEEGGYAPVCIQAYIIEAEEILINVKGTIYISDLADFATVRTEIEDNIETYLENLDVGDNVLYARIHQAIMEHPQVTNLKELEIKRTDVGDYGELDLAISDDEIPDLGSSSFQRG